MRTFHSRAVIPSLFILLFASVTIIGFQNCSSFKPADLGSNDLGISFSSSPASPSAPGIAATPTPAPSPGACPDKTVYLADPVSNGHAPLEVCPAGCTYTTLSAAVAQAVNGDVIEIQAGDYQDCAFIPQNNITIRGVPDASGNRPHFHDVTCGEKGILVVQGQNTLVENLELSNSRDTTGQYGSNFAGIRFDTTCPKGQSCPNGPSENLKVSNLYIHDCDDGILGNNNYPTANDIVDIESSTFMNMGNGGYAHGMYIGYGISLFVIRNSTVYHNVNDGHLVKTRAMSGIIECNTIAALDGVNSYAIDMPQGGHYLIANNVVEQGPNISNSGDFFIRFGEEIAGGAPSNAPHKLQITNTYFVNDFPGTGQIDANPVDSSVDVSGWSLNTFAGTGGALTVTSGFNASSFTNYSNRAGAGLSAYDGTLQCLPEY